MAKEKDREDKSRLKRKRYDKELRDDKKRARLNCIAHLLSLIPYKKVKREKVKLPDRAKKGAYDDQAALKGRVFVPEVY